MARIHTLKSVVNKVATLPVTRVHDFVQLPHPAHDCTTVQTWVHTHNQRPIRQRHLAAHVLAPAGPVPGVVRPCPTALLLLLVISHLRAAAGARVQLLLMPSDA